MKKNTNEILILLNKLSIKSKKVDFKTKMYFIACDGFFHWLRYKYSEFKFNNLKTLNPFVVETYGTKLVRAEQKKVYGKQLTLAAKKTIKIFESKGISRNDIRIICFAGYVKSNGSNFLNIHKERLLHFIFYIHSLLVTLSFIFISVLVILSSFSLYMKLFVLVCLAIFLIFSVFVYYVICIKPKAVWSRIQSIV